MGDREGRHCRWIHEWERLRGLGVEEKDGADEEEEVMGEVEWLRGGRKRWS